MVSFTNTPYHIALAEEDAQNRLFQEILAIEGVEAKWDGPEVEAVFLKWMAQKTV
jgi:hypothetical protein